MLNEAILMGRLTAAPELKATNNGISVTAFSIAIERRYQQQNGEKVTDFINCVAWRNTAEFICKYFNKGDMIAVTGEIQTRKYKHKDGSERIAVEVVVDNASFCGGKNNNNTGGAPAQASGNFEPVEDDDIPF